MMACIYYLNSDLFSKMFFTKTSKISSPILITIDHILYVSSMVWVFINREKFLLILIKLSEIDEEFMKLDRLQVNYRKQKLWLIISFVILILFIIGTTASSTYYQSKSGVEIEFFIPIFNFLIFIIGLALSAHFIVFMSAIGTRLEMINSCIDKFTPELPKIHLKIVDCVNIYNSIYAFPMLVTFGNLFIWTCISTSLIILIPKSALNFLIGFIISLTFTASSILVIIKVAVRSINAKKKAVQLLYTKMSLEPENNDKIFYFIMQIRHTNVAFSCEFFEFNWQLVFKFISACLMYLIIIIQFEGSMH
ncbi:hypothetical protein ACKWTF_016174 [Chironomus riparius]